MKESEEIIQALLKFRNERDWEQFIILLVTKT